MLSDYSIRKLMKTEQIRLTPAPEDHQFQPASIDLRIDPQYICYGRRENKYVVADESGFTIYPSQCILACTLEYIDVPSNLIARVEGKSSWGRQFLSVHSTAGFIDPGFRGQITLELRNNGPRGIRIPYHALICQVSFEWLSCPAERPYGHPDLGSRYQGQRGPVAGIAPPVRKIERPEIKEEF